MLPPPACLACRHYHITWDARFPYGCRAMTFKSRRLPGAEVRQASGEPCLAFEPKPSAPAATTAERE